MVPTILTVDLATHAWKLTIHIRVTKLNHELTARIDENQNVELKIKMHIA